MDAPTAERLSYVEGLRLQSAPQLGDPDFVAQRGFNRFARRYPHLAEQVRRNPGRSSRNSYARETGGRRVAHGLLGEGLESVDENATQTASEEVLERIRQDLRSETDEDEKVFVDGVPEEDGSSSSSAPTQVTRTVGGRAVTRIPEDRDTVIPEDNQTEFSEATLTRAPTSVWYSVDEEETEEAAEQATEENEQQEAAEGDSGEVGQEQYEDNYSSSSYSTGRVVQYVKGELFELVSRKGSLGALRALPRELQVPAQRVAQLGRLGSLRTRIRLSPRLVNRRVTPCCT